MAHTVWLEYAIFKEAKLPEAISCSLEDQNESKRAHWKFLI